VTARRRSPRAPGSRRRAGHLAGVLSATDANGDPLAFVIVTNPSEGRLVVNATTGAFTYTPRGNETTTDQFTFRVSDGKLWSNTASVTVTIEKEKEKEKDEKEKDKDDKEKKR
jgi:hypothetical protein